MRFFMKNSIFFLLLLASSVHAWTLRTGTYQLSGGNSNWSGNSYQGEVIIAPQGDNYSVTWVINGNQAQVGIGILQDDVLSVAFTDLSRSNFWGVASYRVRPFGDLEGKWTSFDGTVQKPEHLSHKSYSTY